MKVAELIAALEDYPPNNTVNWFDGWAEFEINGISKEPDNHIILWH